MANGPEGMELKELAQDPIESSKLEPIRESAGAIDIPGMMGLRDVGTIEIRSGKEGHA